MDPDFSQASALEKAWVTEPVSRPTDMQGTASDRTRLRPQGPLGNILPINSDPPSPKSPPRPSRQVFLASDIPVTASLSLWSS